MKRDLLWAIAILGAGCSAPTEEPTVPRYDAATFFETTSVFGASFSADESRLLVSTDETGVFNVSAIPIDGGEPEALTHSTDNPSFAVSYFPEDDRFLFTADRGGDELNHLYVQTPDGTVTDLTPGEKLKAMFGGWSDDHRSFWVLTNERDQRFFDVYRYQTADYRRELVYQNDTGYLPGGTSGDGRWLALVEAITNSNNNLYVVDLSSDRAPVLVTEHQGDVEHSPMGFTPDNREVLYLTNGHGEFQQAWAYDLEKASHRRVAEADWDILYAGLSERGRYLVTAVNEDARTVVSVTDTATGAEVPLPDLPEGDVTRIAISRSEARLAFYVDSDRSPPNLYVLDLASGTHEKLTDTINPAMKAEHLVEGEVVRYASYDGVEIPGILYRPRGSSAENPAPALVWVHGGPGGQSRKGYRAEIQHLVNHGYAIFAVNNRGSSGYGKTFHHMDDRKHGDADLKDCVWARRYLESLDWVDASRVGIMGGSYGGYMVAAALAFEPDAFDVGIDIFGVTNWLRTLKNIPPWWTAQKDALYAEMGDPATDEERLHRISPLFHATNIRKPLLVVQGANDPRVLQVESDELVAAVEANGVPVEYIVFPDEGHGFRNRANRITASGGYVKFLDTYLRARAREQNPTE